MGSNIETPAVYQLSCDKAGCEATATAATPVAPDWTVVARGSFPRGGRAFLCPMHTAEYNAFWKDPA